MFDTLYNFIGTILIVTAIAFCSLSFIRPKLFGREDIFIIIVLFISGIMLISESKSFCQELPQLSVIMLSIPALFYTWESIRWRWKLSRNE